MSIQTWLSQLSCDILELIAPTRCVVCGELGSLLCQRCQALLPWVDQRYACPVCGAPYGYFLCTECCNDTLWEMHAQISALTFDEIARSLVVVYKDGHERRLAPVIAAAIVTALEEASVWSAHDGSLRFFLEDLDGICFVPATHAAYVRRGFDHMEHVARALAPMVNLPVYDVLARRDVRDQRELGRDARLQNAEESFTVETDITGVRLLLIDDVVTTGASMRAATRALYKWGAAQVVAASLARVW